MRRVFWVLCVVIAVVAAIAAGLYFFRDRILDAGLDDWIGEQLVGVVNTHLVPELSFETLDYDTNAPLAVTVHGAALTAPDGTVVFDVATLNIRLAEVPKRGRPIRIARIEIGSGTVNLIHDPASGGFRGLSPITEPAAEQEAAPESLRLSSVLRLEKVVLSDCNLRYDDGSGQPMTLDGISADLDIEPDSEEPGWYELAFESGREPGLRLDVKGRLNLDTYAVALDPADFALTLNSETAATLPSQLQSVVRQFEAAGAISGTASGTITPLTLEESDLAAVLTLQDFNIAAGDYKVPVQSINLSATLKNGKLIVPSLSGELLDGSLGAQAEADLGGEQLCAVAWRCEGIELVELLRTGGSGEEPPKLAGKLTGEGNVTASLADPQASLGGSGVVQIRDGRLLLLPGITQLANLMNVGINPLRNTATNHRADFTFELRPEGVEVTKSEIVTNFLAARGTGMVGMDGSLDMRVNAGPMVKVQSMLGQVGDIFAKITDSMVGYRIRGTVSEPTVKVEIGGT